MRCTRRCLATFVFTGTALLPLAACAHGLDPNSSAALALQAAGDPAAIAQLAEDAPLPQAAILEDGQVSDGEYEQALTAERACVTAAGYEPSPLTWDHGQLGFTTTASYEDEPDPKAADKAFLASTNRCQEENSILVATIWAAQR